MFNVVDTVLHNDEMTTFCYKFLFAMEKLVTGNLNMFLSYVLQNTNVTFVSFVGEGQFRVIK